MSSNFIFDGGFFFVERTSSAVIFLSKFTWTVAENIDKETPVWVISRGFIGSSASGVWEGSVRPLVPFARDEYKEEKNPAVWDCFKAGWVFLLVPELYIHFITSAWMYTAVITNNCPSIRDKKRRLHTGRFDASHNHFFLRRTVVVPFGNRYVLR